MVVITNQPDISTKEITSDQVNYFHNLISNQIPIVIPKGVNFMNEILKYKSYEIAKDTRDIPNKIINVL